MKPITIALLPLMALAGFLLAAVALPLADDESRARIVEPRGRGSAGSSWAGPTPSTPVGAGKDRIMPTTEELKALGLIVFWSATSAGLGVLVAAGIADVDTAGAALAAGVAAGTPPIFAFAQRMKARAQKMMPSAD